MKIKCMLDTTKYISKPQGYEVGKLQNRLENAKVEIEIKDLAELLSNGCTFKPALLNGKKDSDWISQQLIGLDFDNGTTINDELIKCKALGILPVFGYTTFSHTDTKHKFRLVFCLDEVLTDRKLRDKLVTTMVKQIFTNSDEVVFNAGRLFYGGRNLIDYDCCDYNNRINAIDIINRFYIKDSSIINKQKIKAINETKTIKNTIIRTQKTNNVLHINSIKNLDVNTMKSLINSTNINSFEKWRSEKKKIYILLLLLRQKPLLLFLPIQMNYIKLLIALIYMNF